MEGLGSRPHLSTRLNGLCVGVKASSVDRRFDRVLSNRGLEDLWVAVGGVKVEGVHAQMARGKPVPEAPRLQDHVISPRQQEKGGKG
jgi:hypothetical protein